MSQEGMDNWAEGYQTAMRDTKAKINQLLIIKHLPLDIVLEAIWQYCVDCDSYINAINRYNERED